MNCQIPRRNFLLDAAAVAAAVLTARFSSAAESDRKGPAVRLGGPVDAGSIDPEEMALAHRKLGYRAAYCPEIALSDRERIDDVSRRLQNTTSFWPKWADGAICSMPIRPNGRPT